MSSLNKFGSQLNTNFEKTAQSKASNLAGKFGI
jgi:hypothetical protein